MCARVYDKPMLEVRRIVSRETIAGGLHESNRSQQSDCAVTRGINNIHS
jgi:hypothetical protein